MFMARRRQNVFLDSSFTQNYFFSGSVFSDLIYSINSLPDKFLFGSDFEHLDYKKTLDELVSKFKKNGIEKDVIEKLMFSNFERLFNDNG
jgi:predicted TIM-barrel fold metal-dependent hydrolase